MSFLYNVTPPQGWTVEDQQSIGIAIREKEGRLHRFSIMNVRLKNNVVWSTDYGEDFEALETSLLNEMTERKRKVSGHFKLLIDHGVFASINEAWTNFSTKYLQRRLPFRGAAIIRADSLELAELALNRQQVIAESETAGGIDEDLTERLERLDRFGPAIQEVRGFINMLIEDKKL